MTDEQLQALEVEYLYPVAPVPVPENTLVNPNPGMVQPLYNMPGAQGIRQIDGQPAQLRQALAPAAINFPPAFVQAPGPQQAALPQQLWPLQPRVQPIVPGPPISNRRKRCYPCHRDG